MASSGKKGKKSKGKTLPLNDFLQETPGTVPTIPIRKSNINWADDVDDDFNDRQRLNNVILPTAPKAARGIEDYGDKVSHDGPFIAYLSNLPYDVDDDEIRELFCDQRIASMKIPKESDTNRLRGFGYVEFEDRESLLEVLAIPETVIKGRRIRIELASSMDPDNRRRGGRMDNRDRPERPEVSMGDWRSGPRDQPTGGGGGGGYERRGGDRDRDGGFSRDRGGEREESKPGAWRDGMEKSVAPPANDRYIRDGDKGRDSNRSFSRDYNRDNRDGDRYGVDRGFGPPRGGRGRDERNGGEMTRDGLRGEPPSSGEPRTRPKLNLAPRTVPLEELPQPPPIVEKDESAPEPASESAPETASESAPEPALEPAPKSAPVVRAPVRAPVTSASIFGSAKPVDTSARERQIEERLAKTSIKDDDDKEKGGDKRDRDRDRNDTRDERRDRDRDDRRDDRRDRDRDDRRGDYGRRDRDDDRRGDNGRSPRRASPEGRDNRRSPDRRRYSPPRRHYSPEFRRSSPDRDRHDDNRRRTTVADDRDRRGPPIVRGNEFRPAPPKRDEKPKQRDDHEMPKVKEPEPVNYADANKYSFLQAEGDSDNDNGE